MSPTPLCLSPAPPSELLSHVLKYHTYPSTLIICSSQSDFIASVVEDIRPRPAPRAEAPPSSPQEVGDGGNAEQPPPPPPPPSPSPRVRALGDEQAKHALLSSPLYQVATAKHIRVVYAPTVTHLRAYLSVFTPADSRVPAPPAVPHSSGSDASSTTRPSLLLYGFLELHRDTSEWSAQGLSNTAAALVELAHRLSWQAILVEPRWGGGGSGGSDARLRDLLKETAPILSGGARRTVGPGGSEEGAWAGRTVEVGRVLSRWFAFQRGLWDTD
ncbi:hypothetical protein F5X99DRAFT_376899 [Biscogniauxia marginata]|nr:hypothetical protein F5X99DRAFT_376899 [Biscogniauxia marginata]